METQGKKILGFVKTTYQIWDALGSIWKGQQNQNHGGFRVVFVLLTIEGIGRSSALRREKEEKDCNQAIEHLDF